jgi:hypothetical protein
VAEAAAVALAAEAAVQICIAVFGSGHYERHAEAVARAVLVVRPRRTR